MIDGIRKFFGLPVSTFKPGEIAVFVWSGGSRGADSAGLSLAQQFDGCEVLVLSTVQHRDSIAGKLAYDVQFPDGNRAWVIPDLLRKRRPPEEERQALMAPVQWKDCVWRPERERVA